MHINRIENISIHISNPKNYVFQSNFGNFYIGFSWCSLPSPWVICLRSYAIKSVNTRLHDFENNETHTNVIFHIRGKVVYTWNLVDSAQYRDYWKALVSSVLNLRVSRAMELVTFILVTLVSNHGLSEFRSRFKFFTWNLKLQFLQAQIINLYLLINLVYT
jgi:hypothetical protein